MQNWKYDEYMVIVVVVNVVVLEVVVSSTVVNETVLRDAIVTSKVNASVLVSTTNGRQGLDKTY